MDVDRLLNLEKRTGVRNEDIEDFTRKASDVQKAIQGLLDGTLNPDEIKIEGIESEEEKKAKEEKRQERLREQREKAEKLRQERALEEKNRWWEGAEMFKPNRAAIEEDGPEQLNSSKPTPIQTKVDRYSFNYSKWDQWVPNDEATLKEEEEKKRAEEDIRNKEFEQNNTEFCSQFVDDMNKRKEAIAKKRESADVYRLRGNKFFKAKNYLRSLELYMDALKESPFEVKTLTNIAQVYIKQKAYDDALEFLSRTLFLDPSHVKALSRRAFVLGELGRIREAKDAITTALRLDPGNPDLLSLEREIDIVEREKAEESKVTALVEAMNCTTVASSSTDPSNTTASPSTSSRENMASAVVTAAHGAEQQRGTHLEKKADALVSVLIVQNELLDKRVSDADSVLSFEGLVDLGSDFVALTGGILGVLPTQMLRAAGAEESKTMSSIFDSGSTAHHDEERSRVVKMYVKKNGLLKESVLYVKALLTLLHRSQFLSSPALVAPLPASSTDVDADARAISSVGTSFDSIAAVVSGMTFLAAAIEEVRAAKLVVLEEKLISTVKISLASLFPIINSLQDIDTATNNLMSSGKEKVISSRVVEVAACLIHFLNVCCSDDVCKKTQSAVLSDKSCAITIGEIAGSVCFLYFSSASMSSSGDAGTAPLSSDMIARHKDESMLIALLSDFSSIVKSFAFSEVGKAALVSSSSTTGGKSGGVSCGHPGSIVCAMAAAMKVLFSHLSDETSWENVQQRLLRHMLQLETAQRSAVGQMPLLVTRGKIEEGIERCVEALLGLSQIEILRPFFAAPLPEKMASRSVVSPLTAEKKKVKSVEGKEKSEHESNDAVGLLLKVVTSPEKGVQDFASNAIAALMNACLDSSGAARAAIVAAGGFEAVSSVLNISDGDRLKIVQDGENEAVNFPGNLIARKAGLLGRIAPLPSVQVKLLELSTYWQLCKRVAAILIAPRRSVDDSHAFAQKWQEDEHTNYVRVLASLQLSALSASQRAQYLSVGVEEKVVQALLAVFPTPRYHGGEITPESVVWMPHNPASPLILGNAARCLMPYADAMDSLPSADSTATTKQTAKQTTTTATPSPAAVFYNDASLLGVEKLVCAMATCTDMRVRKNISILLAKGCRLSGVREKVTKYRGMQMMIELQDKL